jgi:hypothetical protein
MELMAVSSMVPIVFGSLSTRELSQPKMAAIPTSTLIRRSICLG